MTRKYLNSKLFTTACLATLFSILLPGPLTAGETQRLLRINYENSSGEKALTRFMYDASGVLYRAHWEMLDKSKNSVNYYQHDRSGKLVSVYRDFSNGVTSYELFNYDSLGNKISEYFYRSDTLSGYAEYQYKDNKLERAVCRHYKGWLEGEIIYGYDSLSRVSSASIHDNNRPLGKISYAYDPFGNLLQETWYMYGWWTQTFNYVYGNLPGKNTNQTDPLIRIMPGFRIIRENMNYNFETGGITIYKYSQDGTLAMKTFTGPDGLAYETEYRYDSLGRILESIETGPDGAGKKSHYTYDDYERIISRVQGEPGPGAVFESYIYDSFGRLARAYVSNYSSLKITGYIRFSYDDYDRLQKGFFTSISGEKADIFITYNNDSLPIEILWNFYSGKFRKITFEFEAVE